MQVPFPPLPAPARLASQDGSTPLLTAAYNGHAEVVDRLIAARAEVDAANKVMPSACHATTTRLFAPSGVQMGLGRFVASAFAAASLHVQLSAQSAILL